MTAGGPLAPTGTTRLAAVIGQPVRHSLSPVLHNAAFAHLGLDWTYLAFEVAAGDVPRALDGMRALGIDGLSVTMPHKTDAARAVDRLTANARVLDAVNCIVRHGDELVGDNTDGPGFLAALADDTGFDPAGRACVVVGAGGAARAVVLALARAGAAQVAVVNRTASRAEATADLAGPVGTVGGTPAIREAELVVNATPVGMGASTALPFDPELVHPGQIVADLVYQPLDTPLLQAASARGASVANGLGMLIHQAALAFEQWTGVAPPVAVMRHAVADRLLAG